MSGSTVNSLSGLDWVNDHANARREIAQLHGLIARVHATLRLPGEGVVGRCESLNEFCAASERAQLELNPRAGAPNPPRDEAEIMEEAKS